MDRAGRLAFGAIIGGLALTLALVAALDPPAPGAPAPLISRAGAPSTPADTLRRCRSVTEADAECEAAWDASRRHFFRKREDKR